MRNERGVALPLALFGLVAVSILVTSALVTSSTEVALSRAHQSGTQALYEADSALEQFVAQRAAMVTNLDQRLAVGDYNVAVASGDQYAVTVSQLFAGSADPLPDGSVQRNETYSLLAAPQAGAGRAVGALVQVTRMASSIGFNIDSGLTLGTNATLSGNSTISDGSSAGIACDSAAAPAAIRHATGTTITEQGAAHDVYGDIVEDDRSATDLMSHVFNGHTVEDLDDLAHIRIGPAYGQPAFSGSPSQTAANPSYQWGCPSQLVSGCSAQQAAYYPTVAIDANGGTIDITNYHGQGVLIIRNGEAHIRGNFKFAGIIVAEGTLRVSGTPRIEGGVIAVGDQAVIEQDDEAVATGNSLIRYNKCMIAEAQRGITEQTLDSSDQTIDTPTFAWYEVIR